VLLDRYLPLFDVSKRYAIEIRAPRERVFEALVRYDFRRSLATRALMRLRGYGSRMRSTPRGKSLVETLQAFGFTLLAEEPGEELVFGLVDRFWRLDGGLRSTSAAEFESFAEPGFAKAAWNLRVVGSGLHLPLCELSTETRVLCFGEDARRKFLRYWRIVEPFSGAIRRSLLRGVRANSLSERSGRSLTL
jgi:hypothetical protein